MIWDAMQIEIKGFPRQTHLQGITNHELTKKETFIRECLLHVLLMADAINFKVQPWYRLQREREREN